MGLPEKDWLVHNPTLNSPAVDRALSALRTDEIGQRPSFDLLKDVTATASVADEIARRASPFDAVMTWSNTQDAVLAYAVAHATERPIVAMTLESGILTMDGDLAKGNEVLLCSVNMPTSDEIAALSNFVNGHSASIVAVAALGTPESLEEARASDTKIISLTASAGLIE